MNLALLNPFRQADRIDSTLTIPRSLHPPRPKADAAAAGKKQKKRKSDGGNKPGAPLPDKKSVPPPALAAAKGAAAAAVSGAPPSIPPPVAPPSAAGAFTIPKKPKPPGDGGGAITISGSNSTKLFAQSLKLPTMPPSKDPVAAKATSKEEGSGDKVAEAVGPSDALALAIAASKPKPTPTEVKSTSQAEAMDVDRPTTAAADGKTTEKPKDDSAMAIDPTKAVGAAAVGAVASSAVLNVAGIAPTPKQRGRKRKNKSPGSGLSSDEQEALNPPDGDYDNYWTACYAVSFDRRGGYLASGHASGLIPVHDFLGRTISALYWPPPGIKLDKGSNNGSELLTSFTYHDVGKKKDKDKGDKKPKKRGPKPKKHLKEKKKSKKNDPSPVKITSSGDLLVPGSAATAAAAKGEAVKASPGKEGEAAGSDNQMEYLNGVTSLSWDRRGRTLLAGAIGDRNLRLMDNTHPLVATDCTDAARHRHLAESGGKDVIAENETSTSLDEKKAAVTAMSSPVLAKLSLPGEEGVAIRMETKELGKARLLRSRVLGGEDVFPASSSLSLLSESQTLDLSQSERDSIITVPTRRHPTLLLELPKPLGGPVQLHPRDGHSGLACMIDGTLALFRMPPTAFHETLQGKEMRVKDALKREEDGRMGSLVYLVPPDGGMDGGPEFFVTCAAFGKNDVVWAVTKCGNLLAFRVDDSMMEVLRGDAGDASSDSAIALITRKVKPALSVKVPGGAAAWQIVVSRNGRYLLINSADCSLRLYDVNELTEQFDKPADSPREKEDDSDDEEVAPRFVFQDNISKAPWASCDFSGDGELVVGGCNSYPQPGDNYKLFMWNCVTGELVDQLTGPVSSLYSLSCHPTRPFIAVGTSDDMIDVWGARLDWVAFAPDFQALQRNELYDEKEDEFDVVVDGPGEGASDGPSSPSARAGIAPEDEEVDVVAIDGVPAFDSDSEDECDVFHFGCKVDKILSEKVPGPKKAEHE